MNGKLLSFFVGSHRHVVLRDKELRVLRPHMHIIRTGNRLIPAEEVSAAMNVTGQPIFMLKPADLETNLRINYPELVSADVTVSLPNVVSVEVIERKPVVRWEQGG